MQVYCTYHNQFGNCTEEDYNDARTGVNPSRMVTVQFKEFRQAVPFVTLEVREKKQSMNQSEILDTVVAKLEANGMSRAQSHKIGNALLTSISKKDWLDLDLFCKHLKTVANAISETFETA